MTVSEMTDQQLRSTVKVLEIRMERFEKLPRMGKLQQEMYRAAHADHNAAQEEITRRDEQDRTRACERAYGTGAF